MEILSRPGGRAIKFLVTVSGKTWFPFTWLVNCREYTRKSWKSISFFWLSQESCAPSAPVRRDLTDAIKAVTITR